MTSDSVFDLILWFSDPQMITAAERECELRLLESVNVGWCAAEVKQTDSYCRPLRLLRHLFLSMQLQIRRSGQAASPRLTLLH